MNRICKQFLIVLVDVLKSGMKINGEKSKVVCINGVKKERKWNISGCEIGEVDEYKYLGVTVKAGLNGGCKSMGDRMMEQNGLPGMVKTS